MMNDNEKKVLENSMWDLATCLNGKPNVILVAFKSVSKSDELLIGDVFLETTLKMFWKIMVRLRLVRMMLLV